jgi:hypothetical protein
LMKDNEIQMILNIWLKRANLAIKKRKKDKINKDMFYNIIQFISMETTFTTHLKSVFSQ